MTHTTLEHVAAVRQALGLSTAIRADASPADVADALDESAMAASLNERELAYELRAPERIIVAGGEAGIEARRLYNARAGVYASLGVRKDPEDIAREIANDVRLREASVAARQAGNMYDPGPDVAPADSSPAHRVVLAKCPNCGHEFDAANAYATH